MNLPSKAVKSVPPLSKASGKNSHEVHADNSIGVSFGPVQHKDKLNESSNTGEETTKDGASSTFSKFIDDGQRPGDIGETSSHSSALPTPASRVLLRMVYLVLGGLLVGATTAIYSVSFAAIIYDGALAPFLGWGIGISLVGATVMAAGSGWLFSIKGTISHPQDITAVMLATTVPHLGAGSGLVGQDLFITTAVMIAVTGIVAGAFALTIGCCKPSRLLKFFPYPVMGGFLAATGYFLVVSAIAMLLDRNVTFREFGSIWSKGDMLRWLPWIGVGLVYAILARVRHGAHKLPLALVVTLAGFYCIALFSPGGLEGAREAGHLMGPFPSDGLLDGYDFSLLSQIDWARIRADIPVIVGVAGMVAVGGLLNLNGLHHLTQKSLDLDSDLRAIGVLNAVSSFLGGLPGYPAISTTFLGLRLGLPGAIAAVGASSVCAGLAIFGTEVLAALPKGIFAAIVAFLGFDLIYSWLWLEARRIDNWSKLLMLFVVLCAVTVGVLEALALGILAGVTKRMIFR